MKEKLINITRIVFSCVTACLMGVFVLVLTAYLAALCIGGETAAEINNFISGMILPKIYIVSVITSFTGLINMYLRGIKAFTLESGLGKKNKGEKKQ